MIDVLRQMLDHRFTAAHASKYLNGELGHAECRRAEQHTSLCPGCRTLLASLRRMVDTLPGLGLGRAVSWVPRPSILGSVLDRSGEGRALAARARNVHRAADHVQDADRTQARHGR